MAHVTDLLNQKLKNISVYDMSVSDIDLSNVNRLYTILLLESGNKHGYQLIKDIERIKGSKPSTSHIYPFLEKLTEQGVAEVEQKGDRGKKVYKLTDEGREMVREQVNSFGEVLEAAIEREIRECANCGCEIYRGGFEKEEKVYCCSHCAESRE